MAQTSMFVSWDFSLVDWLPEERENKLIKHHDCFTLIPSYLFSMSQIQYVLIFFILKVLRWNELSDRKMTIFFTVSLPSPLFKSTFISKLKNVSLCTIVLNSRTFRQSKSSYGALYPTFMKQHFWSFRK